ARATEADPAFAQATIDLATTALGQRIRPRLDVALEAVRLAVASPAGRNPEVQLARGRVEREVGDVDSALAGFQAFLAVGGDSGIGLLELARTLYFGRRPDARTAYLDGARAARSSEAVAAYRTDLSWIATAPELAAFDSLATGEARRTWLARFWERRDFESARDDGERLAEHYRRWFHARRTFFLVSRHRHYDITEVYRTDQREFDDRGVVYLRHGEPDQRASYVGVGVEPNLSWLYRRPEGDQVFHFVAREDVQDYKVIESLADVLGFGTAVRAQGVRDPRVAELYGTRADFGAAYRRIADGMGAPGPVLAEERRAGRRAIALGTQTDSYDRRFPAPLAVVASDFVVGPDGADSGQVIHVVFAVPAGRLAPTAGAEGARYPLYFRLAVADSAGRPVARLDTLRVFTAREPLRGGSYLVGRLALSVPAGALRYRMLVSTPDATAGDLVARDSLVVPRLEGRRFTASDLVMGREGSGLLWARARDTVLLNPLDRVPEGGAAELYYEVYGLTRGAPYHTVVRLEREGGRSVFRRLFGGGRAPVLLEFDAAADGPVTRVHRGVALGDAARGTYRLSITVTDPLTEQAITRTRRFEVVARQ
ncbi:MAG: GWxTD domain-containing protein, partial [Gemmatimonadales bacterium]